MVQKDGFLTGRYWRKKGSGPIAFLRGKEGVSSQCFEASARKGGEIADVTWVAFDVKKWSARTFIQAGGGRGRMPCGTAERKRKRRRNHIILGIREKRSRGAVSTEERRRRCDNRWERGKGSSTRKTTGKAFGKSRKRFSSVPGKRWAWRTLQKNKGPPPVIRQEIRVWAISRFGGGEV